MSDTPPNTGPSHETLANLKAMMPSFIKGLHKKKIIGRGIPAQIKRPRKCCKVCGLLFDHVMMSPYAESKIEGAFCEPCDKDLKDGYTALVCGERYALIKDTWLADWAGQIRQVSPYVMDAVQKKYGAVKIKSNGDKGEAR